MYPSNEVKIAEVKEQISEISANIAHYEREKASIERQLDAERSKKDKDQIKCVDLAREILELNCEIATAERDRNAALQRLDDLQKRGTQSV